MSDLVSIIIPAYNAQEQIREALRSVLVQSYSSLQVLVINDGSTDSTLDIAVEMAKEDSRVEVVNQVNGGVSSARNRGMEMAKGEWVMFMDADDVMPLYAVEVLLKGALETGADIAVGAMLRTSSEKECTIESDVIPEPKAEVVTPADEIGRTLYRRGGNSGPWGKLYRRSAVGELRFVEGMRYEDLEIMPRFYHAARKIVRVDAPVYFYRKVAGSFINSFSESRFDVLRATAMIEEFIARSHPELMAAARDRSLSASFSTLELLSRLPKQSYSQVSALCWENVRTYRREAIFSSKNRIRNRLASLFSYSGPQFFRMAAHFASHFLK